MSILKKMMAKRNIGSVEQTVFHIIAPIKQLGVTSIADENDAIALYSFLLGQRAQAAMFAGQTKGNLLLDTGIDKIYSYYDEAFGKQSLFGMRYDLPMFVFTAMYLESPNFRFGMKQVDLIVRKEVFDTIYTICEFSYFDLVPYPDLTCRQNLETLFAFLSNKLIP